MRIGCVIIMISTSVDEDRAMEIIGIWCSNWVRERENWE